jgi:hypothetical protein
MHKGAFSYFPLDVEQLFSNYNWQKREYAIRKLENISKGLNMCVYDYNVCLKFESINVFCLSEVGRLANKTSVENVISC